MTLVLGGRGLLLAAGAVLAMALAGCSPITYGTGRPTGLQTINDFARAGSLTGDPKEQIDFNPRPTIVAPPPGAALPTPGGDNTQVTADWPNDPDIQAANLKAQIAEANAAGRKIRVMPTAPSAPVPTIDQDSKENFKTTPEQLAEYRRLSALLNGGTKDANGNPVRVFLSDPPPEYLARDPNAPPPSTAATETQPPPRKRVLDWLFRRG